MTVGEIVESVGMDLSDRNEALPLVASSKSGSDSNEPQEKNHAKDVHILSFGFLFVFSAYSAAQNLESTVNDDNDLGTISLGVLYLSFTLFSLIASPMVKSLGSKNALILGSTGYWLFIAANLKPYWYTMIPASLFLGYAASIIWVGQGTYLSSAARSHAKDGLLPEGKALGKFNGEFWGIFASTQVVGNLVSLALLRGNDKEGIKGTTLLFSVFLGSMTLGTALLCFLQKRDEREASLSEFSAVVENSTIRVLLQSIISPLRDWRMLLIIPLFVYSGLQQAYVWSELTKHVITPAFGVSGVGGAMAIYGAFDAVCSFIAGRFTSGIPSIAFTICGGSLVQFAALLWLLLKHSGIDRGTLYPLLVAAGWGVGDGVFNTQLSSLLGLIFRDNTEGAFAQLKVWQSASTSVVFFVSPHISFPGMSLMLLICLLLSLLPFLFLVNRNDHV
ncbi:major facilitator superfamily protein [Wolffia australiana]